MSDQEIVAAALKITDGIKRQRFIEDVCGTDSSRRRRASLMIQEGLANFDKTGVAPAGPPTSEAVNTVGSDNATYRASIEMAPGVRIGPYKLIQLLGEGGMGAVWMASQDEPVRRTVALKAIKPGISSDRVMARFEAERQALALMDHPNIAKVLDAGTLETGQPYFIMELVKGIPVTKYCDEHRLDIRARLELFVPICHAVQHAHMKGIIHRDIKPSNVMVTVYDGRPVPKVIDFGVAKAIGPKLTDKSIHTEFGSVIGTLEYMAPEQAILNALDVDTRSDIYSLGVMLYELLTGSTPLGRETLQQMAFAEVIRQIKEVEPPKPSTRLSASKDSLASISARRDVEPAKLPSQIRGDLDWIVMKSLAKERDRRYDSANGFAADLLHYLNNEPVMARRPSAFYVMRKFARRHRAGVSAVAICLLLLIGATITSTWFGIEARKARDAAQLERDRAVIAEQESQMTLRYFENIILKAVRPPEAGGLGRLATVHRALDVGEPLIAAQFKDHPLAEAAARIVLGTSYHFLGEKQKAARQLRMSWDIRKQHADMGPDHDDTLRAELNLGAALVADGNYTEALPLYEEVVRRRTAAFGADHKTTLTALNNLADTLRDAGKKTEALAIYDDILKHPVLTGDAKSSLTLSARCNRAQVLRALEKYDAAATEFEDVLSVRQQVLPAEHIGLLNSMGYLAEVRVQQGRLPEAITRLEELLPIRTRKLGAQHSDTQNTAYWLAVAKSETGAALAREKKFGQAEPILLTAYSNFQTLGDCISADQKRKRLAETADRLAELYTAQDKKPDADKWRATAAEHRKTQP